MRPLLACCLLSAVLTASDESRLGTLIRWYLSEESPARREDFLETIERLAGGDPRRVMDALRRGVHFQHPRRPVLATGGAHPRFSLRRPRRQPVAACAGDFAILVLPEGYDPARAYPVILELSPTTIPVPPATVLVRVDVTAHAQARTQAWAAEGLVLSLLAHLVDVIHLDPRRVFLRGDRAMATLAWYIALHNPDRFAGVLAVHRVWPGGSRLAPNGRWFTALAIEKHAGDPPTLGFIRALQRYNPNHLHRRARKTPRGNEVLLPTIERWWDESVRPDAPTQLELVCDRGTALRAFWLRMAPRVPSLKPERVGRGWAHKATARPATLRANLVRDEKEGLLVEVEADRVAAFDLYVEPKMFATEVLRVRINGQVPVARVIHLEIADLLEDYRERRDTELLYCCRLTFGVR
ncbi:MAG: hypothetical protein ACYTEZ_13250 [Planctomycetota bacterium]|jgi:hypothetical protein